MFDIKYILLYANIKKMRFLTFADGDASDFDGFSVSVAADLRLRGIVDELDILFLIILKFDGIVYFFPNNFSLSDSDSAFCDLSFL